MKHKNAGLTLIELLIVIAIIAILIIIGWMAWRNQFNKAKDADKKDDLQRISIAFEEYFNDSECYPPADILQNCGGDELSPYLESIPCDPLTSTPYCYVTDEDNPSCYRSYRILSSLEYTTDPIITKLQCHGDQYCGYESDCATAEQKGYNYGITSTNVPLLNPEVSPPPASAPPSSPAASPTPTPPPGAYACDPDGECNYYDDTSSCGITFGGPSACTSYCPTSDPSERCAY